MDQPAAQNAGNQFKTRLSGEIPHYLAPKAFAVNRVSLVIGQIGVIRRSSQTVVIKMPYGIGRQVIQRWQGTQPLPYPLIKMPTSSCANYQ